MSKIKEVLSNSKFKAATAAATVGTVVAAASPAFAEETDISTALTNGLSTVQSDIFGYVAIALPVGLAIFGGFFGIKKVMGFFRSVAK